MAHVNVLQTLALEHGELAELIQQRDVVYGIFWPQHKIRLKQSHPGAVFEFYLLCVKRELKEDLFCCPATIPVWHVGCFNLYFLSGKSFVFNIMSLNIITDSNLATRNNLYPVSGSLTS